jgi:WD40 repeat protein
VTDRVGRGTTRLAPPRTPYRGLVPFDGSELDALLFFGRERECEMIAANLVAARLTVLYGPSGVGKSSILRAGVAHRLLEEPGAGGDPPEVVIVDSWATAPLDEVIRSWNAGSGETYLLLDQFEEFFLYHDGSAVREFAAGLAELLALDEPQVNVLLSIREDALAKLDVLKGRLPSLFGNVVRLDRLDRQAARAAVVRPLDTYNALVETADRVTIESALVDAVLEQVTWGRVDLGHRGRGRVGAGVEADRVEAAYLQLVMERVWEEERRAGSHRLRRETLDALGGAEQIVREHLERALGALSPPEQARAARMFNHLVTPTGMKIAHRAGDLARYAGVEEVEAAPVLARLTETRVLRPVAGEGGGEVAYEIFHDVLAEPVLAWRAAREAEVAVAAERERSQRRHRRAVAVAAGLLVALVAMTAVAVYALGQRSEAKRQAAIARSNAAEAHRDAARAAAQTRRAVRGEHTARMKTAEALQQKIRAQHESARADHETALARSAEGKATRAAGFARQKQHDAEQSASVARAAKRTAVANANAARIATGHALAAKRSALAAKRSALAAKQLAQARAYAAEAAVELGQDPERSVALGLKGVRLAPTVPEIQDRLRDALVSLRLDAVIGAGRGAKAVDALFSPDGRRVVVLSQKGTARVFDLALHRVVATLQHGDALDGGSFSPDGRIFVTTGGNTARLWSTETWTPLRTIAHDTPVDSAAFSRDGALLATATRGDWKLRIWDVGTGLLLATFAQGQPPSPSVFTADFSADGRYVATAGVDRFVRVFDLATGGLAWSTDQRGRVNRVRFAPSGYTLATGGADHVVRVWNGQTGELLRSLAHKTGQIEDVEFSLDGRWLVSACSEGTARVWDTATWEQVSILTNHDNSVLRAAFSPDGQSVVTASADHRARIFEASSSTLQATFAGHGDTVEDAAFSPDGAWVVTASDDGTARLWNPHAQPDMSLVTRHPGRVAAVAVSPDGKLVASAGSEGTVRLSRLDGRTVATLTHGAAATGAWFGAGLLLTSSLDGTARLWRAADGKPLRTFAHGAPVQAAALSPNARLVATGAADGSVKLWDARTGALLRTLDGNAGGVTKLAFDPASELLASGGADSAVKLWRVADGRLLHTLQGQTGTVSALGFSPDGTRILTAAANVARVWTVRAGEPVFALVEHTAPVTSASFSPSGGMIATTSMDSTAILWRATDGARLHLLTGHFALVSGAAFSADGRWLATAGPGQTGIWNVRTGRNLLFAQASDNALTSVAFWPRGWRVVAGGRDGTVKTYDCALCGGAHQLESLAAARLARLARIG